LNGLKDTKILGRLIEGKYSLCFEKFLAANGATPTADFVAWALNPREYSNNNTYTWNNSYSVAATSQVYTEGGTFIKHQPPVIDGLLSTPDLPIDITQRQAFVLYDWNKWAIERDSRIAPVNGFAFLPQVPSPGATLIVYQNTPMGTLDPCEGDHWEYDIRGLC
ncbi:hypothetical protein H0H92_014626, partial [Tricholoma furcatifolium]